MDDVTDVVFRRVILRAGRPDIFFTEFTNAASFCSMRGEISTRGRLTFTPDEQPVVAQIWGTNPDNFREMTQRMFVRGFAGVDINMGCPDKTVVKNGAGSGLIENPDLAVELIRAAKAGASSKIPISVKTRLGSRNVEEFRDWLPKILRENVANLTVHLRTRKEMSKVPAHFELIPEIVRLRDEIAPITKITINGDILSRQHSLELFAKYPGVDGFMIGRGVFANPFCFTSLENPTREQLLDLLNYHLDQFDKFREVAPGVSRRFDPLKHFFKIYVNNFDGAKELREKMMACKTTDEVREIMKNSN